ncbi:hypothetical protein ACRHK7_05320 [Weissella tructae]|uniref:Uncharacterized protein n=2 Tax=Weissella TaxID=46255 RepID=A0A075TVZ4_9LACO|nr:MULTISPECIES: hypothetical protein [Weissella]AIG65739.1 hypothetical protein WS08_0800 [Weissella tructae]AIM63055.1 hypothetical protein WS74_0803 [Weissella ceti]AIM64454.1 hypothetical protein WS105_0864 [Weissella ceti]ELA06808.1 hypothetical protein WCNC_04492 [Weissella ceti NC36]QVV90904.1 hypothetical protein KHQ32_04525 [Weissella tructae]
MIAIGPILGAICCILAYQLKKHGIQLPLVWRGVYCFGVGIVVIAMFWTPGQGVQNIGFVPAGLFFMLGLVYEVKAWLNKRNS